MTALSVVVKSLINGNGNTCCCCIGEAGHSHAYASSHPSSVRKSLRNAGTGHTLPEYNYSISKT